MFQIHGIALNRKNTVEVDFHGAADKLRLRFFYFIF